MKISQLPSFVYRPSGIHALKFLHYAGLTISAIPAIQVAPQIAGQQHIDVLRWSLSVACCVFLFSVLWFRILESGVDRFLLNLEQRIVLQDLPSDQTRSVFVKEVLGETFKDWFAECQTNLKQILSDFGSNASAVEKRIEETADIDPTMQYEIRGRMREACDNMNATVKYFVEYHNELRRQINRFKKEGFAFAQDKDLVDKLLEESKQDETVMRTRKTNLCEKCPSKDCTQAYRRKLGA